MSKVYNDEVRVFYNKSTKQTVWIEIYYWKDGEDKGMVFVGGNMELSGDFAETKKESYIKFGDTMDELYHRGFDDISEEFVVVLGET